MENTTLTVAGYCTGNDFTAAGGVRLVLGGKDTQGFQIPFMASNGILMPLDSVRVCKHAIPEGVVRVTYGAYNVSRPFQETVLGDVNEWTDQSDLHDFASFMTNVPLGGKLRIQVPKIAPARNGVATIFGSNGVKLTGDICYAGGLFYMTHLSEKQAFSPTCSGSPVVQNGFTIGQLTAVIKIGATDMYSISPIEIPELDRKLALPAALGNPLIAYLRTQALNLAKGKTKRTLRGKTTSRARAALVAYRSIEKRRIVSTVSANTDKKQEFAATLRNLGGNDEVVGAAPMVLDGQLYVRAEYSNGEVGLFVANAEIVSTIHSSILSDLYDRDTEDREFFFRNYDAEADPDDHDEEWAYEEEYGEEDEPVFGEEEDEDKDRTYARDAKIERSFGIGGVYRSLSGNPNNADQELISKILGSVPQGAKIDYSFFAKRDVQTESPIVHVEGKPTLKAAFQPDIQTALQAMTQDVVHNAIVRDTTQQVKPPEVQKVLEDLALDLDSPADKAIMRTADLLGLQPDHDVVAVLRRIEPPNKIASQHEVITSMITRAKLYCPKLVGEFEDLLTQLPEIEEAKRLVKVHNDTYGRISRALAVEETRVKMSTLNSTEKEEFERLTQEEENFLKLGIKGYEKPPTPEQEASLTVPQRVLFLLRTRVKTAKGIYFAKRNAEAKRKQTEESIKRANEEEARISGLKAEASKLRAELELLRSNPDAKQTAKNS